jgi:alkylation response protein AidB-like acyl-CoA dehydrogenase
MHFLPTDEQLELQRGVRAVLDRAFPLSKLPAGYDAATWSALVETGVFALRTDLGLGWVEAVLVFEELGRGCVPGPLVATFLTAGSTEGPVTFVDAGSSPMLVPHLDIARALLVLDGADAAVADVPTGSRVDAAVDPLTPLHELSAVPAGRSVGAAQPLRDAGALLTAALQVGLAARLTELAVGYAKTREQFGRAIGSFQAVKHICADMLVRAELARVAVHAAACTLADAETQADAVDAARAIAGAKLLADEAAVTNGRAAIQVHGGMGFTWEVPVHFFLKRAWLHATEWATADECAETVALSV